MRQRTMLVAGAALVAALAGCAEKQAPQRPKEAVPVLAAAAERRDVPIVVSAIGTAEPFQSVTIKALASGELTRVAVEEGQEVRQGDLLFAIDARPLEAALARAEAELARNRAQLENARVEQKRNEELVAKEYITREQYDRSVTSTAALEATLRADEADVREARLELGYATIRAPLGGRMGKLLVHRGNLVKSNDTVLATINQVRPIKVSFSVPELNLPEVRRRHAEGRLAVDVVPQADPGVRLEGKLAFIDNTVDRATGTIQLRADVPNDDGTLWPGQFVTVRLRLAERPGAIVVPTQAVQTGPQGPFVFVVSAEKKAQMRPVTLGPASDGVVVIEDGVAQGEVVVTDGHLRIAPDSLVDVRQQLDATKPVVQPAATGAVQ